MAWMSTKVFTDLDKYNPAELNRENTNVQYLSAALVALGYHCAVSKPIVTSYARTDFPHVSDINYTRQNILDLIAGFHTTTAPAIVVNNARIQLFGYNEANILELNLQSLYDMLNGIQKSFKQSGTFSSGQSIVL